MSELQATLEFSVELNKFYNVDLFQRGYYQIRTALRTPPKVPSKIEITLQKSQGEEDDMPAHVINDMAVSRTFQILYRNEDVSINDVILYRFHTLINSAQLEDELSKVDIQLLLELWFSEDQNSDNGMLQKAECVSTRTINIHFSPLKGLHHHVPILFDYFHLSCIEITVHGTLIAIHQPFLSVPKQPKTAWSSRNPDQSTLETVYFGDRPISADPEQCSPINLHAAWQMHHRICNMLLSGYESLQSTFELYLSDLCGSMFKLEHIDCHSKLQRLMDTIQQFDNEEDLVQTATRDITQLCAANVILWTQFLETATLDQGIIFQLAKEHHTTRVKRLAEAFFIHEYPKNECLACYEPSFHGHSDLASMVRSSMYLQTLPALDLESVDLDGDYNSLPIIFEDIYFDQASSGDMPDKRSSRAGSLSPSFSQNLSPPTRSRPKRNFIKNIKPDTFKRPSSFNLKDTEAASAKHTAKDVVLVGYRKTIASPNVHSKMSTKSTELGTFSPLASSSGSQVPLSMQNSVSMPVLNRTNWSRNSDGTLPEYMKVARQSLRLKKKNKKGKNSIISVDFGGSDSELKRDTEGDCDDEVEDKVEIRKLKRAYTDPVRHLSTSSEGKRGSREVSRTETEQGCSDSTDESKVPIGSSNVGSDSVGSEIDQSGTGSGTAKKQLDFQQEMYDNLSHCLTKALGDSGLNDSDQSDDETCVQNGYDDFLDHDARSQPSRLSDDSTTTTNTTDSSGIDRQSCDTNDNDSNEKSEISPPTSRPGLSVRDVLKINALQLTSSSEKSHQANSQNKALNGDRNLDDVLSISEITVGKDGGKQCSSMDDVSDRSDSCLTLTSSQSTLTSKDSCSTVDIITERDSDEEKTGGRVTVIELLKEEYKRSSIVDSTDVNNSVSDFSDSGVSGMSVKNNYKASSDSNILHSVDSSVDSHLDVKRPTDVMVTSASFPDISKLSDVTKESPTLVDKVGRGTVNFISMRENLKTRMKYQGNLYSESPSLASQIPYFHVPDTNEDSNQDGCHLIVCVHGLDGNSADLRLVKTYMEMALPGYRLEFLMSERNQNDTFAEFDTMTHRLVQEILKHIEMFNLRIARLSFIGHSLGTIIARSALCHEEMIPLLPKLYTFLSLSGPHLGTLYNNSGLVNMGMWFMQKWKKSGSLLQLSLKDHQDPRQSFLYKLSQKPGLEFFKNVLLVGSSQDRYVPYHSSRIEMCKAAQRESSGLGSVYGEMVANILQPIVSNPKCKLIRYDVFHALPNTANTIIGRAAHIAVLDSEIFIEKFLMVCGLKYLK